MNSTFQHDELRNTLKESVSEVLNDTGVLNGVSSVGSKNLSR